MRLHDERGMLGKLAIIWLVLAAVIVVAAVDGGSIIFTKVHLSNVARQRRQRRPCPTTARTATCSRLPGRGTTIDAQDASIKLGKAFCVIDTTTGDVTITLHKLATTLLAGRLSFTKKYAPVSDPETNRPRSRVAFRPCPVRGRRAARAAVPRR